MWTSGRAPDWPARRAYGRSFTLLAGAMARGDLLIDFDGSGWQFLESPGFLLAVFALALLRFGAERSDDRRLVERGTLAIGVVLAALLFAGSLAAGDAEAWPGLIAGPLCALLGAAALGGCSSERLGGSTRTGRGCSPSTRRAPGCCSPWSRSSFRHWPTSRSRASCCSW